MHSRVLMCGGLAIALAMGAWSSVAGEDIVEQHPTAIHSGTCEAPGELVAELVSLLAPDGEVAGSASANAVKQGSAEIDIKMSDIIGGEHILVALGGPTYAEGRQGEIIACGAIGGVIVDGVLTFGLAPANDSSHVGVARLSESDGETTMDMYIVEYAASEAFDDAQST